MERPILETYDENNLSQLSKDDQILASIIEKRMTLTDEIVLLTNDLGLSMRAQDFEVDAFSLPDEYELEVMRQEIVTSNRLS